jgi:hypothetical protein
MVTRCYAAWLRFGGGCHESHADLVPHHPFQAHSRTFGLNWCYLTNEKRAAVPGQLRAMDIQKTIAQIVLSDGKTALIEFFKFHAGMQGSEKVDCVAGMAAQKTSWSAVTSGQLRVRISDQDRTSRDAMHNDPAHHGQGYIPPP